MSKQSNESIADDKCLLLWEQQVGSIFQDTDAESETTLLTGIKEGKKKKMESVGGRNLARSRGKSP